ncbi:tetraacyldisaccharide 4'-kinase [uncultured Thiodictyon sp.]|uniref:tetraacyldisaccharide 4'-kinase n=1 Tax=uncultured Thiodictyon sp. TaxID=1846217 RepID=UPI0025FEB782|nr:tetraacyldisaccharide 4'-kinase [uncultured Thiodictyon sp.]
MDPTPLWYRRHHPVALVLAPLGWLYCAVARVRRYGYRHGWFAVRRLPVPVVVVGNLTVGGTGKTPLTLKLAELAIERGWRPAILMRGYGARSPAWPRVVAAGDDPALVGDEPLLIARRGLCPVVVGPDRVADGALAIERLGCDLLLCDDGLQHYRLGRDLEIAVVDGERGLGNGRCLPAGPLREPRGRLKSVDLAIRNGGDAAGHRFALTPGAAYRLSDPGAHRPLSTWRGQRVTAVAGIGNPGRFFAMLRGCGILVDERPYPDHHPFAASEAADWPAGPVLMTEKDAVKCAAFAGVDHWVCPVQAHPDPAFVTAVFARLGSAPGATPPTDQPRANN